MTAKTKIGSDLQKKTQTQNTEPSIPVKDNDDPAFVPDNDHVASPLDEPAPTTHNFDQRKEEGTREALAKKD